MKTVVNSITILLLAIVMIGCNSKTSNDEVSENENQESMNISKDFCRR